MPRSRRHVISAFKEKSFDAAAAAAAAAVEVSPLFVRHAARRDPRILRLSPSEFQRHLEENAASFGMDKDALLRLARTRRNLLWLDPERLRTRIAELAAVLGISREQAVKAVLRHPQLVNARPGRLARNVEAKAAALGMSRAAFFDLVLRQPTLLSVRPERLRIKFARIEAIAAASGHGLSAHELIAQLPAALCYSDERLAARHKLAERAGGALGIASLLKLPPERVEIALARAKQKQGTSQIQRS